MLDEEKIFSDEQIGVDPNITKKRGRHSPVSSFIKFVKKHKKSLIIVGSVLAVATLIFFLLPEVTISNLKLVNLNATVKIEKGQTAKLKDQNVSVEIVNFVNDPCPEGITCFGSGETTESVEYELTIDDQKYATGSIVKSISSEYQVVTESSDYETYAIIKIVKSDEN